MSQSWPSELNRSDEPVKTWRGAALRFCGPRARTMLWSRPKLNSTAHVNAKSTSQIAQQSMMISTTSRIYERPRERFFTTPRQIQGTFPFRRNALNTWRLLAGGVTDCESIRIKSSLVVRPLLPGVSSAVHAHTNQRRVAVF
jgi:hypothetical protein